MEHLPPVGWADVATKRDLDVVRDMLRLELTHFATKADLVDGLRRNLQWLITTQVALVALVIAAVRI